MSVAEAEALVEYLESVRFQDRRSTREQVHDPQEYRLPGSVRLSSGPIVPIPRGDRDGFVPDAPSTTAPRRDDPPIALLFWRIGRSRRDRFLCLTGA